MQAKSPLEIACEELAAGMARDIDGALTQAITRHLGREDWKWEELKITRIAAHGIDHYVLDDGKTLLLVDRNPQLHFEKDGRMRLDYKMRAP